MQILVGGARSVITNIFSLAMLIIPASQVSHQSGGANVLLYIHQLGGQDINKVSFIRWHKHRLLDHHRYIGV